MIPMIKAKPPSPRMLKIGFISGFNKLPNRLMILVCINSSVATKKGNREGITEFAHKDNPDLTAGRLLLEKMRRQNVNPKNKRGSIFRFNLMA